MAPVIFKPSRVAQTLQPQGVLLKEIYANYIIFYHQ
jgi:hypothetical protein